jgi:xanthine dehydrogenase YagS FAD-binding subunit
VAVNPSDTAPALIALGAQMVIRRTGGERVVEAEDYFIGPGTDITRMTALAVGELLTAIRIPGTFAGARFYFEKVADRNVWDFPLVNVASAMRLEGGTVQALRIAANAVAARPRRLLTVEQAVLGRALDEATLMAAGEAAIAGAEPLRHNGYKVPLLRNLVRRALRADQDS